MIELEVPGLGQTRSRAFPRAMRPGGTDLGRGGRKWDDLLTAWDGSTLIDSTGSAEGSSNACPKSSIGVPFSLMPVPDVSRIFIDTTYFSMKWDKWDVNFRRGDRGNGLMVAGFQPCDGVREMPSHLSRWWRHRESNRRTAVPRHVEINDLLVKKICKDLGISEP